MELASFSAKIWGAASTPTETGSWRGKKMGLAVLMASLFTCATATASLLDNVHPHMRINAALSESQLVPTNGSVHPALRVATDLGSVDDATLLSRMVLSLKVDATQEAAQTAFLQALGDPTSPDYHHWLTPASYAQHFGVAPQDIAAVTGWLKSHGFTIDEVPAGGRLIIFSGTAAQVRAAFHTQLHYYNYKGVKHIANPTIPQIPAALAQVVDGLMSLHDFRAQPASAHVDAGAVPTFGDCSTCTPGLNTYLAPNANYLAPRDFATIYDTLPLLGNGVTGSGQSIAILGESNVNLADISAFRTYVGLSANQPTIIYNGTAPPYYAGDEFESDLDLEWAGAVAPSANIYLIATDSPSTATAVPISGATGAPKVTTTLGVVLSAIYAVNNKYTSAGGQANIISMSYSDCEANIGSTSLGALDSLWKQALSQNMTVVVASGDAGAAGQGLTGCDYPKENTAVYGAAVNGFCSSPNVICAGGTEFNEGGNTSAYWATSNTAPYQSSALQYIPEVVWNESGSVAGDTGLWASGGGKSSYFKKPGYQTTGPGVINDGARDIPDIALSSAGHDGYLIFTSDYLQIPNAPAGQWLTAVKGTSAAAPSFAGILALVGQKNTTSATSPAAINTLYKLASLQAAGGANKYFHQITSGNNSVPGVAGFSASIAAPYYNQATGLGSVDANVLVTYWNDPCPFSLGSTSQSVVSGASSGSVSVTTATACSWTATSNVPWITVSSGASGTGSGSVAYSVVANPTYFSRTGTLTVAGLSYTVTQAPLPDTVPPTQPTNVTVTQQSPATNDGPNLISWTAATDNVGVTGYVVSIDGNKTTLGAVTSYIDPTLGVGSHTISVQAFDAAPNYSTAATIVYNNADTVKPTQPGLLSMAAAGGNNFTLSWGASTDNVAVTGYRLIVDGAAPVTLAATATSTTLTLSPNVTHNFSVVAFDAAGNTSSSALKTWINDTLPPKAPGSFVMTHSGSTFTLGWTASTDNVGVAAYRLTINNGTPIQLAANATSYVAAVTANTQYTYSLVAADAAGNASSAVTATEYYDTLAPTIPTNLTFTKVNTNPNDFNFTITWGASTDNVAVAGYNVIVDGVTHSSTATSYATILVPNTNHVVSVVAKDAAGNVSASLTGGQEYAYAGACNGSAIYTSAPPIPDVTVGVSFIPNAAIVDAQASIAFPDINHPNNFIKYVVIWAAGPPGTGMVSQSCSNGVDTATRDTNWGNLQANQYWAIACDAYGQCSQSSTLINQAP